VTAGRSNPVHRRAADPAASPASAAAAPTLRIIVDRLVLRGVRLDADDRLRLQQAFAEELGRPAAAPPLPSRSAPGVRAARRLTARAADGPTDPAALGRAAARAVRESLGSVLP